jgi:hypothetical protein
VSCGGVFERILFEHKRIEMVGLEIRNRIRKKKNTGARYTSNKQENN